MPGAPLASRGAPSPRTDPALDVLCVGTALVDHLAFVPDQLLEELGFVRGSMNLVDVATSERLRALVGEGRQVSGGSTANTAVGVASLGGSACFVGAVGDDVDGDRYASDLEQAGVEPILARLPVGPGEAATGRCIVAVSPDGERTMATALGLGPQLDAATIDDELVSRASLCYFDGYLFDFPAGEQLVARILEACAAGGTTVAFGLAAAFVVDRHRERIMELLGRVHVLVANEAEATALTGEAVPAPAVEALRRPGLLTAVTVGAEGVYVADEGAVLHVPAQPVASVVDVTGAGDQFSAGFCFGISRGLAPQLAARLGVLAATEVIEHVGARPERPLIELAAEQGLLSPIA